MHQNQCGNACCCLENWEVLKTATIPIWFWYPTLIPKHLHTTHILNPLHSPAANQHACHSGTILSQIQGIEISLCIHIYMVIFTAGLCSPATNQYVCHSGPILSQIQGIKISPCIHIYMAIYTTTLKLNLNWTLSPITPHKVHQVHKSTYYFYLYHTAFPVCFLPI